jgi:hypothetical protein
VVPRLPDLIRPVFQADEVERFVLVLQINDFHYLPPGPGISALTEFYGRRPIKTRLLLDEARRVDREELSLL